MRSHRSWSPSRPNSLTEKVLYSDAMSISRVWGRALAAFVISFALGACMPKPPVEPSGYLGDYSEFQSRGDGTEALIFIKPGLDLSRYERVIIDPVAVALSADAADRHVNPAELMALSGYFHDSLEIALRSAYPIVEEPGDDVIRVRAAITDVIPTKPVGNTVGTLFLPARAISATKRVITGTDLFVGEVAIEAEVLDSLTNERLMALVDRKAGNKFTLKDGTTSWGHVTKAFRQWAVRFRMTLDEAHAAGRQTPPDPSY